MRPRRKPSSSSSNVVGKYRLGDRIGRGGFGEVFYAQNHNTGDFVAVKRIPLRNMKKEQLERCVRGDQSVEDVGQSEYCEIYRYGEDRGASSYRS